jgi:hypothetical protein
VNVASAEAGSVPNEERGGAGHDRVAEITPYLPAALAPRWDIVAIIRTPIKITIKLYSTNIAPESSARKRLMFVLIVRPCGQKRPFRRYDSRRTLPSV